jgi:hypothetical protein
VYNTGFKMSEARDLLKLAFYALDTCVQNREGGMIPCYVKDFDEEKIDVAFEAIKEYLEKPSPEPAHMSNSRPTTPGWYWYELPGNCALQPALVFDAGGEFGLFYTLEPIDTDSDDANRDGFAIDKCSKDARWSSSPIAPLYAEQPALTDTERSRLETLESAAEKVIDMNRSTAFVQYGDANKAESWACVRVLREALAHGIKEQE